MQNLIKDIELEKEKAEIDKKIEKLFNKIRSGDYKKLDERLQRLIYDRYLILTKCSENIKEIIEFDFDQ